MPNDDRDTINTKRMIWIAVLGLAALIAATWATFWVSTTNRLERAVAQARAAGLPMSLADIPDAGIPDEENGATLYLEACELIQQKNLEFDDADPQASVKAFAPALELVRRGAQRPQSSFPRPASAFELGYEILPIMALGRAMDASIAQSTRAGDVTRALADLRVLRTFASGLDDSILLISQIVRLSLHDLIASRAMDLLPLVDDPVALGREVATADAEGAIARGLRGESAYLGDVFGKRLGGAILSGQPQATDTQDVGVWGTVMWNVLLPYWRSGQAEVVESNNTKIQLCSKPYPDAIRELREFEKYQAEGHLLLRASVGTVSGLLEHEALTLTRLHMVQIAAAARTHHREHGAFPKSLRELGIVNTIDRRNGSPLEWNVTGNKAILETADGEASYELGK